MWSFREQTPQAYVLSLTAHAEQGSFSIVAYCLRVRTFLIPILVTSLVCQGFQMLAQTSSSDRKQTIPALLQREHVASVSFAQIVGGKTTLAEAYGEQSPGVATSTATFYNIASMSKPISAE